MAQPSALGSWNPGMGVPWGTGTFPCWAVPEAILGKQGDCQALRPGPELWKTATRAKTEDFSPYYQGSKKRGSKSCRTQVSSENTPLSVSPNVMISFGDHIPLGSLFSTILWVTVHRLLWSHQSPFRTSSIIFLGWGFFGAGFIFAKFHLAEPCSLAVVYQRIGDLSVVTYSHLPLQFVVASFIKMYEKHMSQADNHNHNNNKWSNRNKIKNKNSLKPHPGLL